jgi:hypothetical protein
MTTNNPPLIIPMERSGFKSPKVFIKLMIKTQRRAQRGTKYHAAPTKTAQPALNTARAAL